MNICKKCGKDYKPTRINQKCCSLKCAGEYRRKEVQTKKCLFCGKEFVLNRRNSAKINAERKYCSKKCAYASPERNLNVSKARIGKFTKEQNGKYKGGKTICNGYARISKTGERLHRIVVEEFIGRKLLSEEVIHHINGDKLDNRIENLQIMTMQEHSRLHAKKIGKRDDKGRITSYK